MKPAVVDAVKRGLLQIGHYRRVLERTTFPGVAVLGYHAIRPDDWPNGSMAFENLHVRASVFAEQCALIREACHPITLDEWRAAATRTALPARPVLITFDDGYRSVYTQAAPILARYQLPAVVFACSEPSERRRLLWFDHVAAREGEAAVEPWKSRRYDEWMESCVATAAAVGDHDPRALMTPEEIGALSRQSGIEIGAHTARHPILAHASCVQQRAEIAECRNALRAWTGGPIRAFAYPNGRPSIDYSDDTLAILRDLGFDAGFTMRPSFAGPAEPPLERSRFLVVAEVTPAELAHRLAFAWPR